MLATGVPFSLELLRSLLVPWLFMPYLALAVHLNCSWRPTQDSPSTLGYRRFCLAQGVNLGSQTVDYRCNENLQIADWGRRAYQVLEWRKTQIDRRAARFGSTHAHPPPLRRQSLRRRRMVRERARRLMPQLPLGALPQRRHPFTDRVLLHGKRR